jgi:2-(1,2-epoxy-1,2-dihydrophenyl)acetyl-CoA isomerase
MYEVVPEGELMPRALDLAREMAQGPQVAIRMLKRSIYNAAESNFAQALDDIAARTAVADHHPDAKDGARSFAEKRPPRFNQWLEKKD